jgi:hypothetical protein
MSRKNIDFPKISIDIYLEYQYNIIDILNSEGIMENERKKLLEVFEKLDPINRAKVLSRADLILNIQESTKKRMLDILINSSPACIENEPEYREAVNA